MTAEPLPHREITGRYVLILFVGFFAVVFAVNAVFLSIALSTHTGVVANEPYRKGLKYNERIAAAEQQTRAGWADSVEWNRTANALRISMTDSAGKPVSGLTITATLGRPATASEDTALKFMETSAGHYEAPVTVASAGAFFASFEARPATGSGAPVLYRGRRRLWLDR